MLLLKKASKVLLLIMMLMITGCGKDIDFTQISIVAEINDDVYETGYSSGNNNYVIMYEGKETKLVLMSTPEEADQELINCESNNKKVAKVEGKRIIAIGEGSTKVYCEAKNSDDTIITSNFIDVIVWGE